MTASPARWKRSFIFMLISVTYYIGLHVGAKRPVFIWAREIVMWYLSEDGSCTDRLASISAAKYNVTFDIGLHRVGAPAGWWSGVRYVITKFSCVHWFPISLSNVAPPPARKTPDSTKKLTWHLRVKIPELHPGKGQKVKWCGLYRP